MDVTMVTKTGNAHHSAGKFKARLKLMDEVQLGAGEIIITKRGIPSAAWVPATRPAAALRSMKGPRRSSVTSRSDGERWDAMPEMSRPDSSRQHACCGW